MPPPLENPTPTRKIIVDGWSKGTRPIAASSTLISFKMRRVRSAIRKWSRKKPALLLLIDNSKHVAEYLNAFEERRFLTPLEATLRKIAAVKAEQLILWQTAMWRRRAKINFCVFGDESSKFFHAAANCHARKNKVKVPLSTLTTQRSYR